jgi:hypothetical protein
VRQSPRVGNTTGIRVNKAALLLLFVSCTTPKEIGSSAPQKEITTFSLSRNILWSNADPAGERFVLVDTEVVRLLDDSGDEVWGRRLSIGALRAATFCSKGVVVLGETGAAFLNEDGILQKWPFSNAETPQWASRSVTGECLFDTSKEGLGSWKQRETYFASNGAQTVSLQDKTLSLNGSWRVITDCPSSCPVSLWNNKVIVAEPKRLALFSLADGARQETEIGAGEGKIISLAVAGNSLVLSRDDGSVQVWQMSN